MDIVTCAVQTEVANTVIEKENPKDEEWQNMNQAFQKLSFRKKAKSDDSLLRKRMKRLLIKGNDHDVTISVKDKKFRAHRSILSASSPVFARMLSHNTKEDTTGTINIKDSCSESFDKFLLYVYSGRTENLAPSNALQLYSLADKYDFPVLKERCVSLLKTSLSMELIFDVVLLAVKHQEEELLEVATKFIAQNHKEILVSEGWRNFMTENPGVAGGVIIKIIEILRP